MNAYDKMKINSSGYSLERIQALHKKYAPSNDTYALVFTHCQIVCDIAVQLIETNDLPVDVDFIKTGALLHDIGAYPLIGADGILHKGTSYVRHGVEGEKILMQEGFPVELQRIASHHTGVGISKADVIKFEIPIPAEDYFAETDEELLITYADKFHSKTTPPCFNSYEWFRNDVKRYGEEKVEVFEQMSKKFGIPDLAPFVARYGYDIR